MSVLVTGAGLIGALTAELLAARGERVALADIHQPAAMDGVVAIRCDVTDAAALENAIIEQKATRIVHTAAMLSSGIRRDPLRGVEVNVMGTANVLELARRLDVARVVIASSTTAGYSAFRTAGEEPVAEDLRLGMISDRPRSVYAMTKIAGEQLALLYADLYQLDVVALRYGAVIGGRLDAPTSVPGRLLAQLVSAARDKARTRIEDPLLMWGGVEEFIDARDCARANVCALDAPAPRQRVYNIAPGVAHSMAEFIAIARDILPGLDVELPPEPDTGFSGFPYRRRAPSRAEAASQEIGFRCRYSLAEALRHWSSQT